MRGNITAYLLFFKTLLLILQFLDLNCTHRTRAPVTPRSQTPRIPRLHKYWCASTHVRHNCTCCCSSSMCLLACCALTRSAANALSDCDTCASACFFPCASVGALIPPLSAKTTEKTSNQSNFTHLRAHFVPWGGITRRRRPIHTKRNDPSTPLFSYHQSSETVIELTTLTKVITVVNSEIFSRARASPLWSGVGLHVGVGA